MFKLIQNEFLKLHAKKRNVYFNWCYCSIGDFGSFSDAEMGDGSEFKGSYLDFASSEIGLITLFATIFGITIASRMITDEFQKVQLSSY